MLGAILGDIVGSPYEFVNTRDYDFPLITDKSKPTDDSYMTLAVCKSILESKGKSDDEIKRCLIKNMKGIGRRYKNAGYGFNFRAWLISDNDEPYNSCGNGSAMRVSSIGWVANSLEETLRLAKLSAEVTHNHPEGIKGAQAVAAAVFLARVGAGKKEIRDYIVNTFDYNLYEKYETLYQAEREWNGVCQNTVPLAIICFLDSVDYEDCLRKTVSLGGDSDTNACIAGGIAEAYYRPLKQEFIDIVRYNLDDEMNSTVDRFIEAVQYPSSPFVDTAWKKQMKPVSLPKKIKLRIKQQKKPQENKLL